LAESSPAGLSYPLSDHLGSVRGMSTPAGAIPGRIDYEAWGLPRGGSVLPGLGFTARPIFAGGAIWLRWRHLDPSTGRFASRDQIGFSAGDYNLYRYVGNQSSGSVDPLGLDGNGTGQPGSPTNGIPGGVGVPNANGGLLGMVARIIIMYKEMQDLKERNAPQRRPEIGPAPPEPPYVPRGRPVLPNSDPKTIPPVRPGCSP